MYFVDRVRWNDNMIINIRTDEIKEEDKSLIAAFRLLSSLEYSNAAATWYAGSEVGREDLPPHEGVLALAIALSSTAEALYLFHNLKETEKLAVGPKWSESSKSSFDFINSKEVVDFMDKHLKLIRDKAGFHMDPQPVMSYIKKKKERGVDVLPLWEADAEGRNGHSPVTVEIVAEHLLDATTNNKESARMASKISGAIRDVVLEYISDKLSISVDERS
jgi:hypothetical protein